MKKLKNQGFAPLIVIAIVIAVIALGIGSYFVIKSRVTVAPTQSPTATGTTTGGPNVTAGWKTYTNVGLGFSLQYPDKFKPTLEENDNYNRIAVFGTSSDSYYFEVRLYKDTDPDIGVKYGFLDAEVISNTTKLGGIPGYNAMSTTGYGDAGGQGYPYVEFAARNNGSVYHLIFYGDASVSQEEYQILSTFKFTK